MVSDRGIEGEDFRVWKVIGRSFSVLFQNLGPAGLLALAMLSLPHILGYFLEIRFYGTLFLDLEDSASSWRGALANALMLLLMACLEAVLVFGTYETLQGRRPRAGALIRGGAVRLPPVLAVVAVVAAPDVLPYVVQTVSFEVPWVGRAAGPVAIAAVMAAIFLFAAIPAATVERLGVKRSIERSFELVRSRIFRVIGLGLAVTAIVLGVGGVLRLLMLLAGFDTAAAPHHVLVWPDLLVTAFIAALSGVTATVAYHDLRVSLEGPDAAGVAAVFD